MKRRTFLTSASIAIAGIGIRGIPWSADEGLAPLLADARGRPVKNLAQWKKQRNIIRDRWADYLGILDPNPKIPVLKVLKEERDRGVIRKLVEYEGEPGIQVTGYLLHPEKITGKLPGIVAMHSTSDNRMQFIAGVEEGHIMPFGFRFAQLGYIVFCPQCFLWHNKGDLTYAEVTKRFQERHPGSKGMAKMLFDAQRAVDVLVSLEETDPERIGATGHSLGAKEVLYLGAFDDRVKVIVSNEGGIGIGFSNWDDIWYLGKEIHEFGHQQHEVLALAAPRPFLLIGGGDADGQKSLPYIEAVTAGLQVIRQRSGDTRSLQSRNRAFSHTGSRTASLRLDEEISVEEYGIIRNYILLNIQLKIP